MSQKASRLPTKTDRLLQNQKKVKDLYALNRLRITPRTIQNPSGGSVGAGGDVSSAAESNTLKTQGDTMIGPIAFAPVDVFIDSTTDPANPSINIGEGAANPPDFSTYVLVLGGTPPTDLSTIFGAAFAGQMLKLQAIVDIVIKDAVANGSGNILTTTNQDQTLLAGSITEFLFDITSNPGGVQGAWRLASTGGSSGSGGNAKTGFMLTTSGNTQVVAAGAGSVLDVFDITVIEDGVTVNTTTNTLTPLATGRYAFGLNLTLSADVNNTTADFALVVNGVPLTNVNSVFLRGFGDNDGLYPTAPFDFTADDVLEISISHDKGVPVTFDFQECGFYMIKLESGGGTGGGGYDTIADEGISLPQQSTFNFIGSAVNAVDNPGQNRTDVTITAGGTSLPVVDTTPIVFGSGDPTKQLRFEIDGFTTASTRVMTVPDASTTLSGLSLTQTWTGTNTFTGSTFNVQTSAINLGDAVTDTINFLGRSGTNFTPNSNSDKNLGASGLQWNTLWIDTLQNASTVVINSPNFAINSSQITLGDAITDEVSFLGRVGDLGILPINNSAANLGASGNQWNTLWIDTLDNATTVVVASPNFAINSSQITLGDAITDEISFLGRVDNTGIIPINNSAANLGASGQQWNTLWIDTLQNASSVVIASPNFAINSTQITLGDATTDNISFLGQVANNIVMEEITEPGNAPANTGRFYSKVDAGVSVPFWKDEAGTESSMIGGGGAFLPLAGGTMTGSINMGNNDLTSVDDITLTSASLINLNGGDMTNFDTIQASAGGTSEILMLGGFIDMDDGEIRDADDITMHGNSRIMSVGITEFGIQVDNASANVGSSGMMAMPQAIPPVVPTKADLDGFFGTHEGAMGIDTGLVPHLFVRSSNGDWFRFNVDSTVTT